MKFSASFPVIEVLSGIQYLQRKLGQSVKNSNVARMCAIEVSSLQVMLPSIRNHMSMAWDFLDVRRSQGPRRLEKPRTGGLQQRQRLEFWDCLLQGSV